MVFANAKLNSVSEQLMDEYLLINSQLAGTFVVKSNMNMESALHEMIASTTVKTDFVEVEGVVKSWMIDFYFASLCRLFQDRSANFHSTLKIFEAIVDEQHQSCSYRWDDPSQRTICCFLARVLDGENLDVHYDQNAKITPMMSALPVWESLEDLVSDASLHAKIRTLLIVQCVAVCLRNGNSQMAKDTLQWLETETRLPEKLQGKLTTIVKRKDAYDQLLMKFTYSQLLESIDIFLNTFLQDRSSDFLLEAASKVVQARHEKSEKTSSEQDSDVRVSSTPESNNPKENKEQVDPLVPNIRPKKTLFSKQSHEPWKPETIKKRQTKLRRTSICKVSRRSNAPSVLKSDNIATTRTKRMWTYKEDLGLKAGVRKHGEGKWAMILNEFEFENRTSVMLKDRWRTLKKLEKV
ncbi:telomeric repeat-binding factor 1 [Xyrauchen texanus]|uniref:telomeric repeat-binding factor 1 n=1 Tax=Xyrauchen texanus TaxID=154827 RepID=UPI0022423A80|nr:telomeric repeat-binding factor 1 [Xyrauchen texanus]